jgi:RNA polymerase sigma factor (sigma-70 family)
LNIDDLYEAARSGGKTAENKLFRILAVRLNVFAYRKIRDQETARELVQSTVMKLVEHFREMEFEVSFSAWAYKVLRNDIMNYWKKRQKHKERLNHLSQQQETPFRVPDPALELRVIECLKKLIRQNRNFARVLNLKYQGYDSEEIKCRLNITSSNLYVMLHRARLTMKACLEKGGPR